MFLKKTVFCAVTATALLLPCIFFNANAQTGMGIGTNSPAEKLDVNGAVKIGNTTTTNDGTIRWTGTDFEGYDGSQWITFGGTTGWGLTGNAGTTPGTNFLGTTDYQDLRIRTNNFDRITITREGNVGIATTNATGRFQTKLSNGEFSLWDNGGFLGTTLLGGFTGNAGFAPQMRFAETGVGTYWDLGMNDNSYFAIEASDVARIVVQPGGNVGIGTTNPANRLHVDGSIRMVDGNQQVGYVPVSDANGVMTWTDPSTLSDGDWTISGNNIYNSNTGNVGIGTSSPTNKLTVYGTSTDTKPILSLRSGNISTGFSNGAQIAFGYNGLEEYQHFIHTRHNASSANNAIDFYVSDGTQNNTLTSGSIHTMSLNAGNVGIGTVAPVEKLNITAGNLLLSGSASSVSGIQLYPRQVSSNGGGRIFFREDNNDNFGFSLGYNGGNSGNEILNWPGNSFIIASHNNDATGTVYLTIPRSSGNVGIGTTTPSTKLDVYNGDLQVGRTGNTSGSFIAIRGGKNGGGVPYNGPITNALARLEFRNTDVLSSNTEYTSAAITSENRPGTDDGDLRFYTTSDLVTTEAMNIDYTGNVGIGTIAAEKLHVEGSIRMVDGNQAAGYVPVSDANGTMTWTDPTTLTTADDGDWITSGSNIYNGNTGFVGIGTTTPKRNLHISDGNASLITNNSSYGDALILTSTQPRIYFEDVNRPTGQRVMDIRFFGGVMTVGSLNDNATAFTQNASLAVTNAGNVGIGTAAPVEKLNITAGNLLLSGSASSVSGIQLYPRQVTGNGGGRIFFREDNNDNFGFSLGYNGGNSGNEILNWPGNSFIIASHNNDATGTVYLTIPRSSGNVGIGTTTPSTKLDVYNGDLQVGRTGNTSSSFIAIRGGKNGGGVPYNGPITNALARLEFRNTDVLSSNTEYTSAAITSENRPGTDDGDLRFYTTSDLVTTEAMNIDYTGNVGIGTIAAEKLHVEGSIRMVDGNQAAGYVPVSDANGTMTWTDPTTISTSATTLDQAYDAGGPGAGRIINVTDGPVHLRSGGSNVGSGGLMIGGSNLSNTGFNSMVLGDGSSIAGNNSFSGGFFSSVTTNNSIGFGRAVVVSGAYSTAFGFGNTSSGGASFTANQSNLASGNYSTALGLSDTALGASSIAMGVGNYAPSFAEATLGTYATTYTAAGVGGFNANDRVFTVGNGTATGSRSDAMVILKNGNTGIGATTPSALFHTYKATSGEAGGWRMVQGGNTSVIYHNGNNDLVFRKLNQTDQLVLDQNGNVGVGTESPAAKLDVDGQIQMRTGATAGYIPVSDANGTMTWTDPTTVATADDGDWATNGTHIYKANSGNVGIGTNNPTNELDIVGALRVQNPGTSANGSSILLTSPINDIGIILNRGDGSGGVQQRWDMRVSNDNTLRFRSFNSDLFYFTNTGNLGIGTATPTNLLSLGDAAGSSTSDVAGKKLAVYNNAAGSDFYGLGISANTLQFHAQSTASEDPAMVLTSGGNLGIGTTIPGQALDVNGRIQMRTGATAGYIPVSDANGVMTWTNPATLTTANDGDWTISGSNQYSAVSGSVGIGTSAPTTKLHVEGTVYSADNFALANSAGTGNASAPPFRIDGYSDKLYIIAESDGNGPTGGTEVRFRTAPSNSGAADRVVIDKNGNLGIASLSPSSVLSIYEPDESTTQTNFTQAVNNAGILITSDYTANAYTPGLFWNTSNDNATKPKAGIYLQETGSGTRMLMGTSNNYATGITNTALAINESGNVGIGTTTPAGAFHIVTSNVNNTAKLHNPTMANGTLMGFEFGKSNSADNMAEFRYNHVSDGSTSNFVNLGLWGGANTLVVTGGDAVGIGTTTVNRAKLQINGSQNSSLSYGYLNGSGNTGTSSGTVPYSIYASDRIACSEFNAFSDERIKNIKGISNSKEDLETLMAIDITNYTLKDNIQKGDKEYKKVIAQQVKEVYPQVVSTITDVVPDIYQLATINEGRITVTNTLKAGDRVKLIFENREEIVDVLTADAEGFTAKVEDKGQVFVYGREVDDFHTVDYEALSTLNISATQELVKRINQLQSQNANLEEKYNSLSTDVEALKVLLNVNTKAEK